MSKYDPDHDHRRSIRLTDYDYSQSGAYFVTICTYKRLCMFGDITDDQMRLNAVGEIVSGCWIAIPEHFPNVEVDEFVIMPNHVHGIVALNYRGKEGAACCAPTESSVKSVVAGSVGAIIRSYKSAVTKAINETNSQIKRIWQRNYYEHIIRNEKDLNRIREYIIQNPMKWSSDRENPRNG